jgi:hypothetical protein
LVEDILDDDDDDDDDDVIEISVTKAPKGPMSAVP